MPSSTGRPGIVFRGILVLVSVIFYLVGAWAVGIVLALWIGGEGWATTTAGLAFAMFWTLFVVWRLIVWGRSDDR